MKTYVGVVLIVLVSLFALSMSTCSKLSDAGKAVNPESPCTFCHPTPPATGAHVFHTDTCQQVCNRCHPGLDDANQFQSNAMHDNGSVNITLLQLGPSLSSATYSPSTRQCSNTYCHGNFENGIPTHPTWTKDSWVTCGSCHAVPSLSNAHSSHADFPCYSCHFGATVSNTDTLVYQPVHANGIKDVTGGLGAGIYNAHDKQCSNVICHGAGRQPQSGLSWGEGSAVWTETLTCKSCHDYTNHPYSNANLDTAGCTNCHDKPYHSRDKITSDRRCGICHALPPVTGAHIAHSSVNTLSGTLDCAVCHAGYSLADSSIDSSHHKNFVKDVDGELSGGTFNRTALSCDNTWCHGNFKGGKHANPVWNGTVACGSCHALPPSTGRHTLHVNSEDAHFDCSRCHSGYTKTSVNKATHVNRTKNVIFSAGGTFSNGRCSNTAGGGHGSDTQTW